MKLLSWQSGWDISVVVFVVAVPVLSLLLMALISPTVKRPDSPPA